MTLEQVSRFTGCVESTGTATCPTFEPKHRWGLYLQTDPSTRRLNYAGGGERFRTADGIAVGSDATVLERIYPGHVAKIKDRFLQPDSDSYIADVDVGSGPSRKWVFVIDKDKITYIGSGRTAVMPGCDD